MTQYHISGYTTKVCKAQPGNCPLGGEHFDSKQDGEARVAEKIEKFMEKFPNHHSRVAPNAENTFDFEEFMKGRNEEEKKWQRITSSKYGIKDPVYDDLEKNRDILNTPVDGAPKKVTVYRSGDTAPGELFGVTEFYSNLADYQRPEGAPPRHGSLFASTTGSSFRRWYKDTDVSSAAVQLEVDPNSTYVYYVPAWEDFSWHGAPPEHFWNTGMLLSRYQQLSKENNWDSSNWEVIVPPFEVKSAKEMSLPTLKKLLSESEYEYENEFIIERYKDNKRQTRNGTIKAVETW